MTKKEIPERVIKKKKKMTAKTDDMIVIGRIRPQEQDTTCPKCGKEFKVKVRTNGPSWSKYWTSFGLRSRKYHKITIRHKKSHRGC